MAGWAEGLQGMGAWFSGQGPQYEAAKALESRTAADDERQRRLDKLAGNKLRVEALVTDFAQVKSLRDQGRNDLAIQLLNNRIPLIDQDPDGDSTDSRELLAAISDESRQAEADAELTALLTAAGKVPTPGAQYSNVFTTQSGQQAGLNGLTGQIEIIPSAGAITARAPEGAQLPASLQEMAWLNNPARTPAELDMYWRNKRAEQIVASGGGGQLSVSPSGQQTVVVAPEDAIARETTKASSVSEATTRAAEEAKVAVKKETSAPVDLATGTELVRLLNMAITHPGRAAATGTSSAFNKVAVPGSERKDFLVLADQLKGNAFLQAYSSLKGGGPITDIEGQKATEAQNRLNEAQSEGEYKKALEEMRTLTEARNKRIEAYIEKSPKTVVRRGTDKATGKRVVMYSDGTVEPE